MDGSEKNFEPIWTSMGQFKGVKDKIEQGKGQLKQSGTIVYHIWE